MSRFTQTNTKQEPKFRVVVSGDIAGYSKDDVLTKPEDIADYLRESFDAGTKDTLSLDDDIIITIAQSIAHPETMSNEDWEIEVLAALESRNRGNAPVTIADMGSPKVKQAAMGSIATAEGERLDKNERFRAELHTAGDAPIKVKRAALEILRAMLLEYGYAILPNGELKDWHGHLDMFPRPGTWPSTTDGKFDRKWNPKPTEKNKFAEYYITVGTDRVKYDWYVALVEATAEGKALAKEYDLYADAIPTSKHTPSSDNPYKKNKKSWLEGQKRSCNDRLKGMVRAFKTAMSCYYQMQDINGDAVLSKACGARFVFQYNNKSGNDFASITDGVQPIELWDKVIQGRMQSYTVSGFNNLDIQVALEKEGTYDALVESTARGNNEDRKSKTWAFDDYMDNYSLLAQHLTTAFVNKLMTAANEGMTKDGERTQEAENIIVAHCDMVDNLMPFYNLFGSDIRQKIIIRRQKKTHEVSKDFVPAEKKAS